jgi:hypothetical protein
VFFKNLTLSDIHSLFLATMHAKLKIAATKYEIYATYSRGPVSVGAVGAAAPTVFSGS